MTYFSSTLHFPVYYARAQPDRPRMPRSRSWPRVRSPGKVSDAHAHCSEWVPPPPITRDVWHKSAHKASHRVSFLPTSLFRLDSNNSPFLS